ncbi:ABC transporter substrate-binding protein [Paenibacillus contaminans]|uniref:ABC transporter substrate-binding protein n=1 Tax=Paenibacillus contaminans TaxID=450362 RepID=A0A329MUI6_9BACL|nr:ABC transporter substrate-binding protein [Paenibacillus contaminans]RAV23342.1 ABC transporter substrate-binding protein [Paenibacillus contaminans]
MLLTEIAALVSRSAPKGQKKGKKQGLAAMIILLLLMALASACGNKTNVSENGSAGEAPSTGLSSSSKPALEAKEPKTRTIEHAFGKTEVPLHPKRVAVFGLEDITLSLGVPMVYAYDFDGYFLDSRLKALNIPLSGSADFKPNLEAILDAQPDLIIVQAYSTDEKGYAELSKIAPTIAFTPNDWKSSIVDIGKATGLEDKAQEVIRAYEDKLAKAKSAIVSAVGPDKTVVYMRPSDKDLQVYFPSFAPLVYKELGLKPDNSIAAFQKESSDDWGINTSLEKLPSITADYVFAIYGGSIDNAQDFAKLSAASIEVEKMQVWKAMPAVKQNHVFKVSARHWMMSGPIADGKSIDDVVAAVTGKQ